MKKMQTQDAMHIIFDVNFKQFPKELEDVDFWKNLGLKALKKGNFSVMESTMHKFEPTGMSGFWLLCESHLSFHTWPEKKMVFVDLFSCGDKERTRRTVDILINSFEKLKGTIEKKRDLERGFVHQEK